MSLLRQHLREGTRAAHDRVDAVMGSFDLTSRDGLAGFLDAQLRALENLALSPPPYGLPPVTLGTLLAADLETLGFRPVPSVPPAAGDEDAALGAYYVVAGSRLGAQILRKRWRQASDPRVLAAGRFLSDDSMLIGWKEFNELLSRDHGIEPDAVLGGALDAFGRFEAAGRRRPDNRSATAGPQH